MIYLTRLNMYRKVLGVKPRSIDGSPVVQMKTYLSYGYFTVCLNVIDSTYFC